jgi:hypothetical protein
MPTKPDDKQQKDTEQQQQPFRGVRKYVENNDIAGLMRELDKVPTDTKEAILNKLSISDGNGGRIELDNNQIPIPENIRKQVIERLEKKQQPEQEDVA